MNFYPLIKYMCIYYLPDLKEKYPYSQRTSDLTGRKRQ